MTAKNSRTPSPPAAWVPTLYFQEGLPYVLVNSTAIVMFLSLGMTKDASLYWSSLLALPWALKPLWAPVIDLFGTRRRWIVVNQLLLGVAFLLSGMILASCQTFVPLLTLFFLIGISSATHDAAADGFYIVALDDHTQAVYSGIRSTFYRLATITGQGGLVYLAGFLIESGWSNQQGWRLTLMIAGALIVALGLYHLRLLPRPERDRPTGNRGFAGGFAGVFASFFRSRGIVTVLLFLLLFRLAEAQLRVAVPFLLDSRAAGGLELPIKLQGVIYGGGGVVFLLLGGIFAGLLVARHGLGRWFWPMALALNIPDLVYVYLSFAMPQNHWIIGVCVCIEQFGYGFGFTGFTLFMIWFAGRFSGGQTGIYALMTGIMAVGLMVPAMYSGTLLEALPGLLNIPAIDAYRAFFIWVMICTLPSFAVTALAARMIDPAFGCKAAAAADGEGK